MIFVGATQNAHTYKNIDEYIYIYFTIQKKIDSDPHKYKQHNVARYTMTNKIRKSEAVLLEKVTIEKTSFQSTLKTTNSDKRSSRITLLKHTKRSSTISLSPKQQACICHLILIVFFINMGGTISGRTRYLNF